MNPEIRSKELSIIKDPFNMRSLEGLHIHAYRNSFDGNWKYYANVEFKNGSTDGSQKLEGENLADIALKVEKFIEYLEKETA
jgi:broad specificity phosphatase PhoE